MILNWKPLSMAETRKYIKENKELEAFIKKFSSLSEKEGEEIREKINKFNLIKVKPEHISKIIDILPEDNEDLNKIFIDVGLNEDESKKIIDVIKQYK